MGPAPVDALDVFSIGAAPIEEGHTCDVPTARPRHVLTETDDLAEAIDAAAPHYPGETRADILRHLVQLGAETIAELQHRHRREVIDRAGRYPGLYPAGYLDALRDEWSERSSSTPAC